MTKTLIFSMLSAIILGVVGYQLGFNKFKGNLETAYGNYDDCMKNCDEKPYAEFLEQKKTYNLCLEHNRNIRSQLGQCLPHKPNYQACVQRNYELLQQLKACIKPTYPPYQNCEEHNRPIRQQLPTCLRHKPNFLACIQRYNDLSNQLIDCDSIIIAHEKQLKECRIACNNMISILIK